MNVYGSYHLSTTTSDNYFHVLIALHRSNHTVKCFISLQCSTFHNRTNSHSHQVEINIRDAIYRRKETSSPVPFQTACDQLIGSIFQITIVKWAYVLFMERGNYFCFTKMVIFFSYYAIVELKMHDVWKSRLKLSEYAMLLLKFNFANIQWHWNTAANLSQHTLPQFLKYKMVSVKIKWQEMPSWLDEHECACMHILRLGNPAFG